MSAFTVCTFYKFVPIADGVALRESLLAKFVETDLHGTILIAPEGINSTVCASPSVLSDLIATLRADDRFSDLETKESPSDVLVFHRLKIKLKKEIISIRNPLADPNLAVGTYVQPEDWNELITREDVILVDTRNDYEVAEGTFRGAIDPNINMFGEFPDWVEKNLDPKKHKKVAMFCTGGIRCEKATALLLNQGFEEVYHLKGGIIKYLQEVEPEASLFDGGCFVFDDRRKVDTETV